MPFEMKILFADCGTCPDGSIQNEDSSICYWFNYDKKYYEESEIQCKRDAQSQCASLILMKSQDIQEATRNLITE